MIPKLSDYKINPDSVIGIGSLNKMFEQSKDLECCTHRGNCHLCGCLLEIQIVKTSGGYGLLGGVLYEPDPEKYVGLCIDCYERFGKRKCCSDNCSSG